MKPVPAAGVVLFRWDERGPTFLLLKNSLHKSWGFPKGHAEEGEDLAACAQREVAEETGGLLYRIVENFHEVLRYHVDMPRRDGPGQGYEKEVHYFLGECEDGPTEISPEHGHAATPIWAGAQVGRIVAPVDFAVHRRIGATVSIASITRLARFVEEIGPR